MMRRVWLFLPALMLLCSCQSRNQNRAETNQSRPETGVNANRPPQNVPTIRLTSSAFQEGGTIPKQYTCDGANVSPPLSWQGVPEKARTLALIVDDPDAPSKTWVHWVVFNLTANLKELAEHVPLPESGAAPGGIMQGTNDFGKVGYGGPCPPNGTHRYFFKLYALDTELNLDSKTTKDQLLKAMEGHVLAEGQLMGKYTKG